MARLRKGADPCYRASPSMAWSEVQVVDGPRRCPHIVQRAAMVRRVARAEAASDWMTYGKVSTRRIHGPQYTCLARSKALDRS
jgi:hypothetical protein